jgi:hypothetical protein
MGRKRTFASFLLFGAVIAHLLCEFSLRLKLAGLGQDNDYEFPMTQEQLGDATGLTPVHVNRTMKALEAEGLINRANPRSIHIGDWTKLADAGDFDSNYDIRYPVLRCAPVLRDKLPVSAEQSPCSAELIPVLPNNRELPTLRR